MARRSEARGVRPATETGIYTRAVMIEKSIVRANKVLTDFMPEKGSLVFASRHRGNNLHHLLRRRYLNFIPAD